MNKKILLFVLFFFLAQSTALAATSSVIAKYGMKGESVRLVQQYLIKTGYLQEKPDSKF